MGVHARAEKILVGADSHHATVARWIDRVNGRVCCSPFYIYTVIATTRFITEKILGLFYQKYWPGNKLISSDSVLIHSVAIY